MHINLNEKLSPPNYSLFFGQELSISPEYFEWRLFKIIIIIIIINELYFTIIILAITIFKFNWKQQLRELRKSKLGAFHIIL